MTFVVDIVTGASQGIGRSIAEYIAHQRSSQFAAQAAGSPPYRLVLVGRSLERGTKAAASIAKSTGLECVFESCNVSDWNEVTSLKKRIGQRTGNKDNNKPFQVGILVNDAAECPQRQEMVWRNQKQENGDSALVEIDKQFATNILGYHFMMKSFQEHYSASVDLGSAAAAESTHIVNIASNWAGNLDLNDLSFKRRGYDNDTAYRQSKQADRMLSKKWSEKLKNVAIVNSCHPGDPCTTLSKALGYNMFSSAPTRSMIEKETPIPFLCEKATRTGGWYQGGSQEPMRCQFEHMTKEASRLFEICESFC